MVIQFSHATLTIVKRANTFLSFFLNLLAMELNVPFHTHGSNGNRELIFCAWKWIVARELNCFFGFPLPFSLKIHILATKSERGAHICCRRYLLENAEAFPKNSLFLNFLRTNRIYRSFFPERNFDFREQIGKQCTTQNSRDPWGSIRRSAFILRFRP